MVILFALLLAASMPVMAGEIRSTEISALPSLDCVRKLRLARIAEQSGEIPTALAAFREAIMDCPNRIEPKVELLSFARRHALPEPEKAELSATFTNWLSDAERGLLPSTLEYLAGNPDLGKTEKRAVLDATLARLVELPKNRQLLETAASLQLEFDQPEPARELFGRLLDLHPDRALRWMCIELDRRLERWNSVVALLEPMLEEDYDFFVAMSFIEALAKTNQYDKVVTQLDVLAQGLLSVQMTAIGPTMNTLLRQVAWDLRDQGDFEGSEKIFRRLLATDPQDAEARAAILHFYSTREEQVAQQLQLERQWKKTEDPDALLARGGNLLASGDAAGAIDLLQRAADALQDSEIAWFNLGLAAIRLENWLLADESLSKATALNPGRAIAFLNHGTALEKLGRCQEAVEALNRALAIQPDLGQAHYYLYVCYTALGDHQKGLQARKKYDESRSP